MRWILLGALILGAGCNKGAPSPPEPTSSTGEEAPGKPKKPSTLVEMHDVSDERLGYTIRIPKQSRQLQRSQLAHTFSLPLPDGLFELNVNLTPAEHGSLDDLARLATMAGQKATDREEILDDGAFLVVKLPQGPLQEVWLFRRGETKHVTAKCTGPSGQLKLLLEMCQSLGVD